MPKNIIKIISGIVVLYTGYYLSLFYFSYTNDHISYETFLTFFKYYSFRPDKLFRISMKVIEKLSTDGKWIYLLIHLEALSLSVGMGCVAVFLYNLNNNNKTVGAFGNSHFCSFKEAKKTGYFDPSNIILGKAYGRFIGGMGGRKKSHILIMAPTQSYKTTGMVIPTMLHCKTSMIVNDMKNEIYRLSSGYRKEVFGQEIIYFNPTDLYSRCYNPLDFIRSDTEYEIGDAQLVANNLIDEEDNRDTYWVKEARSILVALVVYVLHEKSLSPTLGQIWELINDPTTSTDELLEGLSFSPLNIVALTSAGFLNKSDRDRSGCISTLKSFLNLWADPIINKLTSKSEFSFRDFNKDGKNSTLYICTPPDGIGRVRQLQKLLWAQAIKSFMSKVTKEEVVLMLDEFPALGRIDDFEEQIAYIAGYGITAVIICQDLKQLEATYKKSDSIINNCKIRVTGASNDERTAQRIEKWAGITTVNPLNRSQSGSIFSLFLTGRGQSQGEAARPLINYGEIMQLPELQILIFKEATFPIYAQKVPYFKHPKWVKHTLIPPVISRENKIEIDSPIDKYRTTRIIKRRYHFPESEEQIHENLSQYSTEQILKALKLFNLKAGNLSEGEKVGINYLYGILKNIQIGRIYHQEEIEKEGVNKLQKSKLFPDFPKPKRRQESQASKPLTQEEVVS